MKFKINTPNIVHELIDGEVIIVNLKQGDYYSLLNTSAEIWTEIEREQSSAQIVAQLIQNYHEEPEIIAQGVQSFLDPKYGTKSLKSREKRGFIESRSNIRNPHEPIQRIETSPQASFGMARSQTLLPRSIPTCPVEGENRQPQRISPRF